MKLPKKAKKKTRKFKVCGTYVAENDVVACGVSYDSRGGFIILNIDFKS